MLYNYAKKILAVGIPISYFILLFGFVWVMTGGKFFEENWLLDAPKEFFFGQDVKLIEAVWSAGELLVETLLLAGIIGSVQLFIIVLPAYKLLYDESENNEERKMEAKKALKQTLILNYVVAFLCTLVGLIVFGSAIG